MNNPIRQLTYEEYPRGLSEIPEPPETLYVRGTLAPEENRILTVVGSRALSPYGAVSAARFGAWEAPSPGGAAMLRRTVSFPPFVALVVAFALLGVALPGSLTSAFDVLAASLTPLAMVGIGLRLSQRRLSVPDGPVVLGLGLRLFVLPAAVLAVAGVGGGRSSIEWDVSVLQSATPPMITAGIVATAAGLDEDTVTSLVGLGVVIALFTLPVWAVLIG